MEDLVILEEDAKYIQENFDFSQFKDKTLMIIGANGFLGRNFINAIIDCLDIFKKIFLVDIKMPYLIHPKITRIESDIRHISEFFDTNYIIHLASIASPEQYLKNPLEVIDVNINGLQHILEVYKNNKNLESFLYFSTSEIFGDAQMIPTPEDYIGGVDTLDPRSCYAESKRMGENICFQYHKLHDMPIKIVRPFNVYGPLMSLNDGRLPSQLAKSTITKKVNVHHPDCTRSYCYVSDAIIGFFKALMYPEFEVFNIGNTEEVTNRQFAELFVKQSKEILKIDTQLSFEKEKNGGPARRCPDISKAKKLLNYNPQISLEDGIERYIKFLGESK